MNPFFSFSRGEWIASIFIIISTIIIFIAGFYNKSYSVPTETNTFKSDIEAFYEEQKILLDSTNIFGQSKHKYNDLYYNTDTGKKHIFKSQSSMPLYEIVRLNINTCDSFQVRNVPQFGNKRSQKLIEYRERLGGFYSFDQVREVYILQNLDNEFLQQYFFIGSNQIRKIQINKATYKELIQHPYLDSYLAKLIINHREKGNKIHNINDFQHLTHAYQELLDKLEPYLNFDTE